MGAAAMGAAETDSEAAGDAAVGAATGAAAAGAAGAAAAGSEMAGRAAGASGEGVGGGSSDAGAPSGADSSTSARFPSTLIFFFTTFFTVLPAPRFEVEPRALGESLRLALPFGGLIGGGLGAALVGVAFLGAMGQCSQPGQGLPVRRMGLARQRGEAKGSENQRESATFGLRQLLRLCDRAREGRGKRRRESDDRAMNKKALR